ncbi:MAG: NAD(P)/FAD-dependent oxidoreductase [Pseudomonadales bacterium]
MEFAEHYDVIVIGSGPGGSVCSTYLAQSGKKVLCLEKSKFPRFHIGESLTGSAGQIIKELGLVEDMNRLDFPQKPGVTVIGNNANSEFFVPVLNPTWQVRRSDFDDLLYKRASQSGVIQRTGIATDVIKDGEKIVGLTYRHDGQTINAKATVVVDASGQGAFLSKKKIAGERKIDSFSRQIAFYTHYENVERDPGAFSKNTSIFYSDVLHWAWIIPISSTVDSLGIVIPVEVFREKCKTPEAALQWGLDSINPELTRRFANAKQVENVRAMADYSYRIEPYVGDGWLCIGDAHRFLDPIFSFGVSFAMLEGRKSAQAICQVLEGEHWQSPFYEFRDWSDTGQDIACDLIQYFWKYPVFFGYQMQNTVLRREVIRLFGGECFEPQSMTAPAIFRKGLMEDAKPAETVESSPNEREVAMI